MNEYILKSGKKLTIKNYYSLPCELEIFSLDKEKLQLSWFGYTSDDNKGENIWECGNKQFHSIERSSNVPEFISNEDYLEIQDILKNKLNIGFCNWCI